MVQDAIRKSDILIEALPYIKKFHKKIFIIKYGGSILSEERIRKCVLEDITFLRYAGIRPIIVHGGGPNITEKLRESKIVTEFVEGMRVTNEATLQIVEQELNNLNDLIVKEIEVHGIKAVGFKKQDNILTVEKKIGSVDLGFVGEVIGFDREKLESVLKESVPVICPMGL
ncbi:MAG: acetylglutamate kinase, partial [Candidatus Omnitrophica bacterium]|nr:acetylglutamate kinase [Candidatus Omnitrophota bacterium]